jgi:hypothetical protein
MKDMTMGKFSTLGRTAKLAVVTLALAALAACATPFNAEVSRFQSQLPAPQGQTFAVVAEDPALAGGLEFSQYAGYVAAQMEKLGYKQASPDDATMLVRFDYGVDNGRERVTTNGGLGYGYGYGDPFFSPWYGYEPVFFHTRRGARIAYMPFRPWGYGWYDPFFGGPEVDSYTVYTSGIDLKIDRASDGMRLFEGKAQAVSTSNHLPYLVPNLVEAMFTGFPGDSGQTVRISIAPEKMPVQRDQK